MIHHSSISPFWFFRSLVFFGFQLLILFLVPHHVWQYDRAPSSSIRNTASIHFIGLKTNSIIKGLFTEIRTGLRSKGWWNTNEWEITIIFKVEEGAIPLLGIYLEKIIIQKDTFTPVFTAALFIITRPWQQPVSTDRWMDKNGVVNIYNGILLDRRKEWNNVICSNMGARKRLSY